MGQSLSLVTHLRRNAMQKITKRLVNILVFFIGFHAIYFFIVWNYPLINLTNEQGSKLNSFLVSLGNPNTEEAYYFIFNSIFILAHAIVSLIILFSLYYLFKFISYLFRLYR